MSDIRRRAFSNDTSSACGAALETFTSRIASMLDSMTCLNTHKQIDTFQHKINPVTQSFSPKIWGSNPPKTCILLICDFCELTFRFRQNYIETILGSQGCMLFPKMSTRLLPQICDLRFRLPLRNVRHTKLMLRFLCSTSAWQTHPELCAIL